MSKVGLGAENDDKGGVRGKVVVRRKYQVRLHFVRKRAARGSWE